MLDAYGWPRDLSDDEVLARLLALNGERAAGAALRCKRWVTARRDERVMI